MLWISFLVFSIVSVALGVLFLSLRGRWDPEAERIRRYLSSAPEASGSNAGNQPVDILRKKRKLSDIDILDRVLERVPYAEKFDLLLEQADLRLPVGVFVLLTLLAGLSGFTLTLRVTGGALPGVAGAALAAGLPYLFVRIKVMRRIRSFERQLPDALDLIARALKAGHAFSSGLMMAAREFKPPLGSEFERALGEVNLGMGLEAALKNMTERIRCPDLQFFAISVLIQKETGGNLAEILESISRVIRERFKLRGRVRTLSAEGRTSAAVMIAIPIGVSACLHFINPGYLAVLASDPTGRALVGAALAAMATGIVVMRQMIAIKI